MSWTEHLPKLRARMTVEFPESIPYHDQLRRLKAGECLPCGCVVTDTAWTRERASAAFYEALAEIMAVPEDKIR